MRLLVAYQMMAVVPASPKNDQLLRFTIPQATADDEMTESFSKLVRGKKEAYFRRANFCPSV